MLVSEDELDADQLDCISEVFIIELVAEDPEYPEGPDFVEPTPNVNLSTGFSVVLFVLMLSNEDEGTVDPIELALVITGDNVIVLSCDIALREVD